MDRAVRTHGKVRGGLRLDVEGHRGFGLSMVRPNEWWVARNVGSVIWCEMYLLASFGFLRDMFGLPGAITYLFDVINAFLFIGILVQGKHDNESRYYTFAIGFVLLFLFSTLVGGLLAGDGAVLYLWGIRNTFRFYAFFVCCVTLLSVRDIPRMVLFFKRLFFVNVGLCLFEYSLGYSWDYVGGTFAVGTIGGNAYLNLLLVIVLAIYVTEYLAQKTPFAMMVLVLLLCCLIIAIAELKVFFFELPLIVLLAISLERFTARSAALLIVMLLGIIVGLYAIQFFFSGSGFDFFTEEAFSKYMGDGGYTSTGDLSRLNAVRRITNMFFLRNPLKLLFGFGLGNCSNSSFAALTSWFYNHYSRLHYNWFSDAYVYVETGLIGLFLYEAFFVVVFVISRLKRYRNPDLRAVTNSTGIVALMAIFLSVYNSSISVESGYMAYLLFAVPFILDKYRNSRSMAKRGVSERPIVAEPPVKALRKEGTDCPCEF